MQTTLKAYVTRADQVQHAGRRMQVAWARVTTESQESGVASFQRILTSPDEESCEHSELLSGPTLQPWADLGLDVDKVLLRSVRTIRRLRRFDSNLIASVRPRNPAARLKASGD